MRKTTLVRSLFTFLLFALVSFGVKGQESQVLYYEDFDKITSGSPVVNNVTAWTDPLISPSSSIWTIPYDGAGAASTGKYTGASGGACLLSTRAAGEVVFNFGDKLNLCSGIKLSFGYRHPFAGQEDQMKLLFSNDGGQTWQTENKLPFNDGAVGWYACQIDVPDDILANFAFKFVLEGTAPLNGAFRIDDVKLVGVAQGYIVPPTFSVISGEIQRGTKVEISSTSPNVEIHYTINGGEELVGSNPLTIVPEKFMKIEAWATEGSHNSEKISRSYSVVEKRIFVASYNNRCFALFSEIVSSKELKANELELTNEGEPILSSMDYIWELIPVEGNNAYNIRDPKTQRYITNEINLNQPRLYLTSNIKTVWSWNEAKSRFELYDSNNTLRTIWFNEGSNFKAFTEAEINLSVSAQSFKSCNMDEFLYRLNGMQSSDDINKLIKRDDLKWIDLSEATIDQPLLVEEPANPNCLIYTKQDLAFDTNVIKGGNCNRFYLTDKKPFGLSRDFTAYSMTYIRNAWQDGGWETIILPYSLDASVLPKDYIFDEYLGLSADKLAVQFKQVTELEANKPYLMKYVGENKGDWQRDCVFENEYGLVSSEMRNSDFVGVYSKTSTAGKFILGVKNGETIFGKGTSNAYVMPFRAYLDITQPAGVTLMKMMHTPLDATALEDVEDENWHVWNGEKGEIIVRTSIPKLINVVSIEGRLVRSVKLLAGEHVIDGLNSGFYIVNGEKIMIK